MTFRGELQGFLKGSTRNLLQRLALQIDPDHFELLWRIQSGTAAERHPLLQTSDEGRWCPSSTTAATARMNGAGKPGRDVLFDAVAASG